MTMKQVNLFILSVIFIFSLTNCTSFNSLFDKEDGPKESIEAYIQDVQIAESDYKVAIYCIEDGNEPLSIYDYFDYGIQMGNVSNLEIDYTDGVYHAFSNQIQDG